MKNYAEYQLTPSVLDACKQLRKLLQECEDTNIDVLCQTELGVRDYDGQPNPLLIDAYASRLKMIAMYSRNLISLTTYDERRAIEAQELIPWRFER